jgi:hypothetical protein
MKVPHDPPVWAVDPQDSMQVCVWLQRSEHHKGAEPDLRISVIDIMDQASMKDKPKNVGNQSGHELHLHLPRWFRQPVDFDHSELLWNQSRSQAGQDLFVIAMLQGRRQGTWLEFGAGHPMRSNNTYLLEKRFEWSGISLDRVDLSLATETPYEEYWSGLYNSVRQDTWPEHAQFSDLSSARQNYIRITYHYDDFIGMQITDADQIPRSERRWQTVRPRTRFMRCDVETEFDFNMLDKRYDYLQIDLDPPYMNLWTLEQVLRRSRFSVLTFEHDAWNGDQETRDLRENSRKLLRDQGYHLVIPNVTIPDTHLVESLKDVPTNFEDWWVDPDVVSPDVIDAYTYQGDEHEAKYYYKVLFET